MSSHVKALKKKAANLKLNALIDFLKREFKINLLG